MLGLNNALNALAAGYPAAQGGATPHTLLDYASAQEQRARVVLSEEVRALLAIAGVSYDLMQEHIPALGRFGWCAVVHSPRFATGLSFKIPVGAPFEAWQQLLSTLLDVGEKLPQPKHLPPAPAPTPAQIRPTIGALSTVAVRLPPRYSQAIPAGLASGSVGDQR